MASSCSSSPLSAAAVASSSIAVRRRRRRGGGGGGTTPELSSQNALMRKDKNTTLMTRTTSRNKASSSTSTSASASASSFAFAAGASSAQSKEKVVWIETTNVQVLLSALEIGLTTTALFNRTNEGLIDKWKKVGRFTPLWFGDEGVIHSDGGDRGAPSGSGPAIGVLCAVEGPEDVADIAKLAGVEPLVVMDSSDWQVIPAAGRHPFG